MPPRSSASASPDKEFPRSISDFDPVEVAPATRAALGVCQELGALTRCILTSVVRPSKLAYLPLVLAAVGCNHRTVDSVRARKLSDEFMSDMIAHRTDAAFDKMEPEFTTVVSRSDFAPQLNKLLEQYCGW